MLKRNIKVSVIVPVYNVEKYIEECIKSILSQSLKEIEIIIVNDGTKDKSMEVIKNLLEDERIIVINKQNGGLSSARNEGLKIAKGEYIAFVDSDDYIDTKMLEELYKVTENKKYDIVFSNFIPFSEKGLNKEEEYKDRLQGLKNNAGFGREVYVPELTVVWNKIYKRNFLKEQNLLFTEGIIHEDNNFTLKAFLLSDKVYYLQKGLYFYRNREGSIINSLKIEKQYLSYKKIYEDLKSLKIQNKFAQLRLFINTYRYYFQMKDKEENKIIKKDELKIILKSIKEKIKNISLNKTEKKIIKNDLRWMFKSNKIRNQVSLKEAIYWGNNIYTFNIFIKILKKRGIVNE